MYLQALNLILEKRCQSSVSAIVVAQTASVHQKTTAVAWQSPSANAKNRVAHATAIIRGMMNKAAGIAEIVIGILTRDDKTIVFAL